MEFEDNIKFMRDLTKEEMLIVLKYRTLSDVDKLHFAGDVDGMLIDYFGEDGKKLFNMIYNFE